MSAFHVKGRVEEMVPFLTQAGKACFGAGAPHPIYTHTRLTAYAPHPSSIIGVSTNLEIYHVVNREMEGLEVLSAGVACVPTKPLLGLLKQSKIGPVEMVVVGENLRVIVDGSEFTFACGFLADFPEPPGRTEFAAMVIPLDQFTRAVRHTAFAASQEQMRFALNGISVGVHEFPGKTKRAAKKQVGAFVATDGRRLSIEEVDFEGGFTPVIVPTQALQNAVRWVPKKKGEPNLLSGLESVRIAKLDNDHITIAYGDFTVISRQVEGSFPNIWDVVPKTVNHTLLFEKEAMVTALKHALRATDRDANAVRIEVNGEDVTFSSRSAEMKFSRIVKAHVEGGDIKAGFNPEYLLQMLAEHDGESVSFGMEDVRSPAVIRDGRWTYVLMPISLE